MEKQWVVLAVAGKMISIEMLMVEASTHWKQQVMQQCLWVLIYFDAGKTDIHYACSEMSWVSCLSLSMVLACIDLLVSVVSWLLSWKHMLVVWHSRTWPFGSYLGLSVGFTNILIEEWVLGYKLWVIRTRGVGLIRVPNLVV